jgi:hypothetical protein
LLSLPVRLTPVLVAVCLWQLARLRQPTALVARSLCTLAKVPLAATCCCLLALARMLLVALLRL